MFAHPLSPIQGIRRTFSSLEWMRTQFADHKFSFNAINLTAYIYQRLFGAEALIWRKKQTNYTHNEFGIFRLLCD